MALFVLAVNKGLCATFRTILVKMALINEKPVNAELFKVDDRILTLGVIEFFELRLDCFSGFH